MSVLVATLLKVSFGALAGGLTNTVAVWMLFHPYRPPRLFGRWRLGFLHGAIPKSQPRLAAAMGEMVGRRLLTPEDLAETFREGEFREAFDSRLAAVIDSALHTERGAPRDLAPAHAVRDLETLLDGLVSKAVSGIERYIDSAEFEAAVAERTRTLAGRIGAEPLGSFLTPSRARSIHETAGAVFEDAVSGPGLERAVDGYVEAAARRLLASGSTFEEALPEGMLAPVERVIGAYLPIAARRLGDALDDHVVRRRVELLISDLLERFLGDLRFHKRLMARFLVNEDTVQQVVRAIRTDGSEKMSGLLRDSSVQAVISRGIREGFRDLLRRPIADVVGDADQRPVVEARRSLTSWVVELVRQPETRRQLDDGLRQGVEKLGEKTWDEVLQYLPPEKVAASVVEAARSQAARALLRDLAGGLAHDLLNRPLGVPARWLPDDAADKMEAAVSDPLWDWLQTQIPSAIEQIDIAGRVEDKVLRFPMRRLEEIIRGVTRSEIKLIVRLGFVMGGVIGGALAVVETVLR